MNLKGSTHNTHTQEIKMSNKDNSSAFNKSGYELRADLHGMAIGILESRRQAEIENEHLKPEGRREPVSGYTTEDVISEAATLYNFVRETGKK
mgnify:CR=1 FL=1